MVNFNGNIQENSGITIDNNRGFLFGDSVFETVRVVDGKILFAEEHYFRLMASMRICRMEIPMEFTLEYFENEILKLIQKLAASFAYRARFSVFRKGDGFYLPKTNEVDFLITVQSLASRMYQFDKNETYEVEIYKDAHITKQLFSTLKTNNKMIHVAGSIFANENGYANCLLVNDEKNIVEALQSNVFMLMGNQLITPPIADGCLNGIMRKNVLKVVAKMTDIQMVEKSISPFDLQKADEIFLTNVITGIQPVAQYRKKTFKNDFAKKVLAQLNATLFL
ncbi:aminotransferase class IV [Flavobacterium sp. U410]|jgi:branched-chain amino acid aminotransferase